MKMTVNHVVEITLTLSQGEAVWLKGLMQNPLHGISLTEENGYDRGMREKFWNELDKKV